MKKVKKSLFCFVLGIIFLSILIAGCTKQDANEQKWAYKPMISKENYVYGDTGKTKKTLSEEYILLGEIEEEISQIEPMIKGKIYFVSNTLPIDTEIYGNEQQKEIIYVKYNDLFIKYELMEGANEQSEGIKSITLSFDGNPLESYSYKLTEEENIKEAMRVYKKLKTYKSPEIRTWFEDVTYEIEGNNGKIETTTFKKVRPVSDLFKKIFNSIEVREQAVPVLTTGISEIGKLEMFSVKTGEKVVYNDRDNIEQLMLSLKEYYSSDKVLDQDKYTLIEVELFNINDEYIGNGFIYRDDKETQNILDKQGDLNNLIVTPSDIKSMLLIQGENKIEILDINIMQVVLDNYRGYHTSESIISVEYHLKETKDMRLDWHGSFSKDVVPKEIRVKFD